MCEVTVSGWAVVRPTLIVCRREEPARCAGAAFRRPQPLVPAYLVMQDCRGVTWSGEPTPVPCEHAAPDACRCGAWIWRTPEQALQEAEDAPYTLIEADGWGQVVEHEHGWRCMVAAMRSCDLRLPLPAVPALDLLLIGVGTARRCPVLVRFLPEGAPC